MATDVELDPAHDCILVTHSGHVSPEELWEIGEKGFALAREADTWRFVSDCAALTWAPQIVDQLGLAQHLQDLGVVQRYRQALVRPTNPEAAATVREWETVSVNRGLAVRVVPDLDAAYAWLSEV